jgi:thioredoxin-like negative regulator of GroEL
MIPWGEQECPVCGKRSRYLWSLARNELILLSFLILIILFVVTSFLVKAYLAKERALAQQWYASGERELQGGHPESALQDFRSALVYSQNDSGIELQLANALAAAGHRAEARAYLLGLWDQQPGNGTVNLELARLAAKTGSVPEAIQYYRVASYGLWEKNSGEHRRQARLELAEYLLSVGEKAQAEADLMALAADWPADPDLATHAATLLLNTGDYEHASLLFRQALRLRPTSAPALEGAGETSFEMGNYQDARRFLSRAKRQGSLSAHSQSLLETSTLILEIDPLAPRLDGQERVRRVLQAFSQSMARLNACAAARGVSLANGPPTSDLQKLHALALALQPKVRARDLARNSDLLLKVTDLVFEIEKLTERECGEPQGMDLALFLLSRARQKGSE